MKSIYFLTLGCDKNTVDSENMMYLLKESGYEITDDSDKADAVIINTCSFINDAMEESINAIIGAGSLKEKRPDLKIIVTGCLSQRYAKELKREIPEADAFVGTGHIYDIVDTINQVFNDKRVINTTNIDFDIVETGRVLSTPKYTAYVKLSEGCNKRCTYCIIPHLRGKQRSRKKEDIIHEVALLVSKGVKEIILIAQDIGEYGVDLYGKRELPLLLDELQKFDNLKWIRLLYLYPETITDELIDSIKRNDKVLHYVDIPIQHINDDILRKMNRSTSSKDIKIIINRLRTNIPDIKIRSTFITGFPGETKENHIELIRFLMEYKVDRAGFFKFSREEGTPAYDFENQIDDEIKEERYIELMKAQEDISESLMEEKLDKVFNILVEEEVNGEENVYIGRTYFDAPDIDGVFYIYADKKLEIGEFVDCIVTDTLEYDLIGRTLDEHAE